MHSSTLQTPSPLQWLVTVVALALVNVFVLAALFGLAHQLDPHQPAEWVVYLLDGTWLLFGPILVLLSQIDAAFRIHDHWYYLGVLINSVLWANIVIYAATKFSFLNKVLIKPWR